MPDKNGGGGGGGICLPPAGRLSYVMCGEPLLKAEYLDSLVGLHGSVQAEKKSSGAQGCGPVVYIDFDMMYGGFAGAGMASRRPGGMLHVKPDGGAGARRALGQAVSAVSAGAATVIIDTLNGLYDMAGDTNGAVRRADASIMMLAMAASSTRSRIVVACVAEPHRDGAWYLLPGRRRLAAASARAGNGQGRGRGASLLQLMRGRAGLVIGGGGWSGGTEGGRRANGSARAAATAAARLSQTAL